MLHHELAPNLVVHTHACGEGGIFVNAFLVETPNAVVAIDSTLSESESKSFRAEVDALGKPLVAILVTHPHPDHVAGITNLVGKDAPKIVPTQPIVDLMRRLEAPKRAQWTPVYGAEWVQRWTYPDTIVRSGDTLTFDGVAYSVLDIGPGGDSEANSVWFIDAPKRTAFLSDLAFNGTHSYVADGYLMQWLANLAWVDRFCAGIDVAFPGHGAAGAPGELIRGQHAYLLTLAGHVKELANGQPSLSGAAKQELERRMTAYAPSAGLAFLIAMSADPIARELHAPTR